MTLFTLLDEWASEQAQANATLDAYRVELLAELRECATMDDVDDVLVSLSDEPGPFLEGVRHQEFERRFGVRRVGNVVHVAFGGTRG